MKLFYIFFFSGYVAIMAGVSGCTTNPKAETTTFVFQVTDDEGAPIPQVLLQLADKQLQTNQEGIAQWRAPAPEGQLLKLKLHCPQTSSDAATNPNTVTVRHALSDDTAQTVGAIPITTHLVCVPHTKEHVVIVTTNETTPLPVNLNGKVATHTNAQGVAQFVVTGAPNDEIEIVLDTTEQQQLQPQMPHRLLKFGPHRQFFIFSQNFERPPPKAPKKKRRKRGPRGPIRI